MSVNPKLTHDPVLDAEGKPDRFALKMQNIPCGTGWYGEGSKGTHATLKNNFLVCALCRSTYMPDGDNHGACPAKVIDMLKEHLL